MGVAVNVALPDAQMVKDGVEILTAGVTIEDVVIVNALLVAVGVLAQDALLAINTVTILPSVIADVVNVALLIPTFAPFIFH